MAKELKIEQVKKLSEKLNKSKSLILTEYHGLSVPKMEELRSKLQEVNADFAVTKNTLLSRAAKEAEYKDLPEQTLTGPTATLFAYGDEIAPIKSLVEFIKTNELPNIKAGFLGKTFLTKEKVLELSKLPGYDELVAKVVGGLNAPLYGLVNVLQGNIRNLVNVLDQISKQK